MLTGRDAACLGLAYTNIGVVQKGSMYVNMPYQVQEKIGHDPIDTYSLSQTIHVPGVSVRTSENGYKMVQVPSSTFVITGSSMRHLPYFGDSSSNLWRPTGRHPRRSDPLPVTQPGHGIFDRP